MKKKYTQPTIETWSTPAGRLMVGSGHVANDGKSVTFTPGGDGDEADADEGCSRRGHSVFEDGFFRTLLIFVMMAMGLWAHAQSYVTVEPAGASPDGKTHAMRLYLRNQTTVDYSLEDLDHVTYLPGIGMKVYLKNSTTSVDYLYSQMTRIEYAEDANSNANWEKVSSLWTDYREAWRLEYPQLSDNVTTEKDASKSQIVVKRTDDYGITYSLEWDNAKIANRWTCYQLHAGNSLSAATRKDDFKSDPEVAVSSQLSDYTGSGFSRGHLCPSADRLCSEEQNKQTFFLTNMQPQYQSHNAGLWGRLEEEVRNYATDDSYTGSHCDTLYIVKAATITGKVTIDGEEADGVYPDIRCGTNQQLLVPKYFYMALLHYNKATDTYHALAFWTEHKDELQQVANLGDYAISIDELERRTGIDFFCNLPDVIENAVESTIEPSFWKLTKSQE